MKRKQKTPRRIRPTNNSDTADFEKYDHANDDLVNDDPKSADCGGIDLGSVDLGNSVVKDADLGNTDVIKADSGNDSIENADGDNLKEDASVQASFSTKQKRPKLEAETQTESSKLMGRSGGANGSKPAPLIGGSFRNESDSSDMPCILEVFSLSQGPAPGEKQLNVLPKQDSNFPVTPPCSPPSCHLEPPKSTLLVDQNNQFGKENSRSSGPSRGSFVGEIPLGQVFMQTSQGHIPWQNPHGRLLTHSSQRNVPEPSFQRYFSWHTSQGQTFTQTSQDHLRRNPQGQVLIQTSQPQDRAFSQNLQGHFFTQTSQGHVFTHAPRPVNGEQMQYLRNQIDQTSYNPVRIANGVLPLDTSMNRAGPSISGQQPYIELGSNTVHYGNNHQGGFVNSDKAPISQLKDMLTSSNKYLVPKESFISKDNGLFTRFKLQNENTPRPTCNGSSEGEHTPIIQKDVTRNFFSNEAPLSNISNAMQNTPAGESQGGHRQDYGIGFSACSSANNELLTVTDGAVVNGYGSSTVAHEQPQTPTNSFPRTCYQTTPTVSSQCASSSRNLLASCTEQYVGDNTLQSNDTDLAFLTPRDVKVQKLKRRFEEQLEAVKRLKAAY